LPKDSEAFDNTPFPGSKKTHICLSAWRGHLKHPFPPLAPENNPKTKPIHKSH